MPARRIVTADRELQELLTEIITRLDRLDGGSTEASWPSFPERINIGDGALVIRHTGATPDELELLLVNSVPGPPSPSYVQVITVP